MRWVTGRSRIKLPKPPPPDPYHVWIARYEAEAFAQLPAASDAAPCIYFLLTGDGPAFQASVESIHAQTDPNWRLIKSTESAVDGYIAVLRPGDQLAPSPSPRFDSRWKKSRKSA